MVPWTLIGCLDLCAVSKANLITGGTGNDVTGERGGRDTIEAGAGGDKVVTGNGADRSFDEGAGFQRLHSFDRTGEQSLSQIQLSGSEIDDKIRFRGDAWDESARSEVLRDHLKGWTCNDALDGGRGGDLLIGGAGEACSLVSPCRYVLLYCASGLGR